MTVPDETHNSEDLETTITLIIKKWKQKAAHTRASDTQLYQTPALNLTTGTKSFILSCTEILKITMKPEATDYINARLGLLISLHIHRHSNTSSLELHQVNECSELLQS